MRRAWRFTLRAGLVVAGVIVVYELATFAQVWRASTADDRRAADAIVVFGAAQYDGRPSPVLRARLDHVFELWDAGLAPILVVTGGRRQGDRFTEATVSANYLIERGVPDGQIRREVQGTNSWESLAAAARFLDDEGVERVLLVSDDYHAFRIEAIADELGLDAAVSPVDSGLSLAGELKALARETAAVSLGRIIGYRRLMNLDRAVERVRVPNPNG